MLILKSFYERCIFSFVFNIRLFFIETIFLMPIRSIGITSRRKGTIIVPTRRYTESGQDRRGEGEIQPPPRRSRLFKTRAETKRAQVNWLSSQAHGVADRCENGGLVNERRWRGEDSRTDNKENRLVWRDQSSRLHQDRWCRDEYRRSRIFDGKNTLQRSMSSPEFQAELMQVARKVRNKLNCGGRSGSANLERGSDTDRCLKEPKIEETKRPEKRAARNEASSLERAIEGRIVEERRLIDRCNRTENKLNGHEDHKGPNTRNSGRTKNYVEERQAEVISGGKRHIVEKSTTLDETAHSRDPLRKSSKDRLDAMGQSSAERLSLEKQRRDLLEDYQRAKSVSKSRKYENATDPARTRSESPVRPCVRDPRGQASGRESTPERTSEAKEREKERDPDRRWRKSEVATTDNTLDEEKRRPCEPVPPATAEKDAKPKEKLARKPEVKEVPREKNWHV